MINFQEMKKILFYFLMMIATGLATAQSRKLQLEKLKDYPFEQTIEEWNIDNLGNVYIVQGNTLVKSDSTGKQIYSQSIKSIGKISQIEPINAMKIILFSEEQQSICIVDNTLTLNGDCKYLDDFNVQNAKFIAVSGRSNLIWVYDEFKSTMLLIDFVKDKIIQRVENLIGIIDAKAGFFKMSEKENYLYVYAIDGNVYEFDQMLTETGNQYGDFQEKWDANREFLVSLQQNSLFFTDKINNEMQQMNCPEKEVLEFKMQGDFFYFLSGKKISKYSLK
jgi:hypothetical protein